MQENIGYACMTETPCVIVDVQRSGPSTGQPTEASQGDMMQACWGSHGDYEIIALAPANVQECLTLTIEAFNLAEKYRNPVLIMTDGEVGHMRERVNIPVEKDIHLEQRLQPKVEKKDYVPFKGEKDGIPCLSNFGNGYHVYVTGLTHNEKGFPATDDQDIHNRLVCRVCEKISQTGDKLTNVEKNYHDNPKIGIVSYGITSRAAISAVTMLREKSVPASHLRLITVWPFPYSEVYDLACQVETIYVPEMNMGQIVHSVREASKGQCNVIGLPKIGGVMHTPYEILDAVGAE
jgi:2-oxoglutarate ferredoxin oxidoreductase subunit alpha